MISKESEETLYVGRIPAISLRIQEIGIRIFIAEGLILVGVQRSGCRQTLRSGLIGSKVRWIDYFMGHSSLNTQHIAMTFV